MKLLYGTTNNGKLQAMKNALKDFDIELIGLKDLEGELPTIKEDGATPLENAKMKARAYFEAFGIPVFSCDSGLYFEELRDAEQPGLHVRRVNGKELTDEEMIVHYAALAEAHGGKITGRYRNAIYFILDENRHFFSMDMSIATEPFVLVTKPHEKRVKGFPLDSLSVDIATGKYYYDLDVKDVSTSVDDGVRAFFTKVLKEQMPKRLERTTIYESDHVCLYADKVLLPSGYIIEKYHQIHYPKEAVAVVIFNEKNDILFIHNRRYTVGHLEWEIPAGKIEPGEDVEAAAAREAKEETGCELQNLKFLCSQNPCNGMSDALVHVFAAQVSAENQILDTDEISSKRWFTEEEYMELLRTNGTKDGVSMLAVLYALRFYK